MVALGALLLLGSLPSEWMTIRNAVLDLPGGSMPAFGGLTVKLTGFSGSITLLGVKLPIWLIVALGILSLLLIVLNQFQVTSLPSAIALGPGAVAAAFMVTAVALGIFGKDTSLGVGGFLALAGLACGWLLHFGRLNRAVEPGAPPIGGPGLPSANPQARDKPPPGS